MDQSIAHKPESQFSGQAKRKVALQIACMSLRGAQRRANLNPKSEIRNQGALCRGEAVPALRLAGILPVARTSRATNDPTPNHVIPDPDPETL